MSVARHHADWLSLVESSGPFLSIPVLLRVFPQGLEQRDRVKASKLREAYEDWLDRGATQPAVHHAWIRHVLTELLEYPPEFLAEGQAIPPGMEAVMASPGRDAHKGQLKALLHAEKKAKQMKLRGETRYAFLKVQAGLVERTDNAQVRRMLRQARRLET